MGSILCEHCAGGCCRYVAIPLDKPTSARDYDDIRWYLMHEAISVFVEDGDWYIQFQARCRQLAGDNRCMKYDTRPHICREYKAGECDYNGGTSGHEQHFTHEKQIEDYYRTKTGRKLGSRPRATKRKRTRSGKKKSA